MFGATPSSTASGSAYGGRPKLSSSPLPSTYSDAVHEKHRLTHGGRGWKSWFAPVDVAIPIPGNARAGPRVRLCLPAPILQYLRRRPARRRGIISYIILGIVAILLVFSLGKRFATRNKSWPEIIAGPPPTLVYGRSDLRRIWLWEIASGHYPSTRPLPQQLNFPNLPYNPGISKPQEVLNAIPQGSTIGTGVSRTYYHANVTNPPYPPRPIPGSIIDLDKVQEYCSFTTKQYVRDCLEILRLGAGLNYGNNLRRAPTDKWQHVFTEQEDVDPNRRPTSIYEKPLHAEPDANAGLEFSRKANREPTFIFREPLSVTPHNLLSEGPCDPEHPHVFHIFWAGPFTDKPYIALLSFLFTQNVGLHEAPGTPPPANLCRPQMWIWINPGPAASVPNPRAVRDMYTALAGNPWSAPFLHPRFEEVIKFKLWNTTEQLDGIPEIKDEWRKLPSLFNAGGYVYNAPQEKTSSSESSSAAASSEEPTSTSETLPASLASEFSVLAAMETESANSSTSTGIPEEPKKKGGIYERLGSNSEGEYDRMSVILSDMARFVLTHRFGGVYLDADTIFLRDWEELWGWKGAFAYRWSRLEKYNTAVLKMHKNSALGSWLFRTALKNDFDFHPMTVSNYAKEAYMDELLQRLPDALFDPAWLNVESYQIDRPAFPYFTEFKNLFELPRETSAQPVALGFENFFRGAFSYHFHNFWWVPFDPARNWPDLGKRFIKAERAGRAAVEATKTPVAAPTPDPLQPGGSNPAAPVKQLPKTTDDWEDILEDDVRDLSWGTVLKRTFEAYIRGERPNMYGEYIVWS
ncbi:hypothetical protein DL93DRAFT_2097006 [Clavulina sp. PMI_390]|nr:hypothetical protein DL93DRAFT_2097006 [Clavulina sp. PMI_390]